MYNYIQNCIVEEGYSPTGAEVANHFGLSNAGAWYTIDRIVRKGWLTKTPSGNIALGTEPTPDEDVLTKRQSKVYSYIKDCVENKRYSPGRGEIAKATGYNNSDGAYQMIKRLIDKGWLERDEDGGLRTTRKEYD